jgi:hypothetical protein
MRLKLLSFLSLSGLLLAGCAAPSGPETPETSVSSPDGSIVIDVNLDSAGHIFYTVNKGETTVIKPSGLGFEFKDWPAMAGGFEITNSSSVKIEETWEMPWGEQKEVSNHCNELTLDLRESGGPGRKLSLILRAYDDGVAFRYAFAEHEGKDSIIITDELTEFQLAGDHTCWWIPGDWDIYEHLYNTTKFSEIDAISKRDHPNLAQTYIPENAVNTPVTMKTTEGLYLAFHEANLTNYSGMTLKVDNDTYKMTSELVGSDITGYKAKVPLPFKTPWRTIQIGEKAVDLINSMLIVNLNEPNKLGDVSWFKPMTYVGIWWEMHLGKSSWDLAAGKHGATTSNAKKFIDFAAENNIGGLLVEGWNTGWEHWIGFEDREGVFDFVTPYPDYDIEEVVRYADEKGVEIIMHHETSAAPRTYDQQMDTAYALMQNLGIHSVKTGYVGPIIPKGEYHHGQWMVNHYRRALETAAKYQVAINAHEPIKDTGIRRTYPNAISREGLRGQEFNAWSNDGGNPPEHLPIVAFTRMLSGPIDYTPGIFHIKLGDYNAGQQVNTTIAQQLALYVVIYSPIQMAADLVEHYEGQPGLQFIREVGVDWEKSIALNGEPGDFVTIARKEKGTDNWFLGSITDENPREIQVALDFLEEGKKYTAHIYADGDDAHWDDNPTDLKISEMEVDATTVMDLKLAPGGGVAVSILAQN